MNRYTDIITFTVIVLAIIAIYLLPSVSIADSDTHCWTTGNMTSCNTINEPDNTINNVPDIDNNSSNTNQTNVTIINNNDNSDNSSNNDDNSDY